MFKKKNRSMTYLFENIEHRLKYLQIHIDESQQRIIESQQRTIEQLTNALQDKYEHGLFVIGEEGKLPMVIRDGKELTNDKIRYVSVDWTFGEVPNITIEQ